MPGRQDRWWSVQADTNIDSLCKEVGSAIIQYGVPFFKDFRNSDGIFQKLRSGEKLPGVPSRHLPLIHAMLAKEKGFVEEAKQQIERAISNDKSPLVPQAIQRVASRLGISMGSIG